MINILKRFAINEPIVFVSVIIMISSNKNIKDLGPLCSILARKYILPGRYEYPLNLPSSYKL